MLIYHFPAGLCEGLIALLTPCVFQMIPLSSHPSCRPGWKYRPGGILTHRKNLRKFYRFMKNAGEYFPGKSNPSVFKVMTGYAPVLLVSGCFNKF